MSSASGRGFCARPLERRVSRLVATKKGSKVTEKVTIGNAELWHGDCREVLPLLPDFDLILTDPPYGIGEAAGKNKSRNQLAKATDYGDDAWDNEPIALAAHKAKEK